jgi:hypothetical protein
MHVKLGFFTNNLTVLSPHVTILRIKKRCETEIVCYISSILGSITFTRINVAPSNLWEE